MSTGPAAVERPSWPPHDGPHLVTGGSGYFGSLLVRMLRDRGVRVRVFDLQDADDRPSDVEFVQGDIRDADAVSRACGGCAVVHHNVAMVPLAKDKEAFWSVNVGGTETLLQASLAAGVQKVISTSSSAVYGIPERNPVDDSVKPRPREAYGRAKLAAEDLCARYVEKGLDVTIIRPRTIMGHGRLGIMQILFEWIRDGRNVPVFGRGDNIYQFVHADDLAEACIRAAARPGANVFNVGASRFGTMRELLEGVIRHAGTASRVVSVPLAPAKLGMTMTSALGLSPLGAYHALMYGESMYFDISRTRTELGWEPTYSNLEMFQHSYDWYLAHREQTLAVKGASHHRSPVRQGILAAVSKVLGYL
jgi:nucleoside-diphosphate-sugar epimerase